MDNECLYLCPMASMLSMGALKCTVNWLSLLHPLLFIINVCDKCVMLALIVINGNDDPRLFLTHQYPKEILLVLIEELAKFYVVNPIFSHIFFVHKYLTK